MSWPLPDYYELQVKLPESLQWTVRQASKDYRYIRDCYKAMIVAGTEYSLRVTKQFDIKEEGEDEYRVVIREVVDLYVPKS